MRAPTLGALTGLALAFIWAVAGFWWVLLAGVLAGVGVVVGLVVEGRVDLTKYLGHGSDGNGPQSVQKSKEN